MNSRDILSGRFMVLYSLDLSELILKKMNEKNARKINREIERDLLKDSFKIINEFKKFISYTFRIDKIS